MYTRLAAALVFPIFALKAVCLSETTTLCRNLGHITSPGGDLDCKAFDDGFSFCGPN
jgi:hypothetical protein